MRPIPVPFETHAQAETSNSAGAPRPIREAARAPQPTRRRLLCAGARGSAALIAPAWLATSGAAAQGSEWPNRPIQLILPVPPGGGVDLTGRRLAEGLSKRLNVAVTCLNQPSAAGLVAGQQLRAARPDGYTLGYLHSGHVVHQAMADKLDMLRDFTPIGMFSGSQFCIAVSQQSAYRTLNELLDAIRKSPGRLNYGAGGNGSPGHIAWEKLVLEAGGTLDATQVPFKAAVESVLAVAQGQIDFLSGLFSTALALHRSGKVRILAVTGPSRSSQLPEVPTVAEAARLPRYAHVSWGALFGPAGIPDPIVSKLDQANRSIANDATFQAALIKAGSEPRSTQSPAELRAFVTEEVDRTIDMMKRLKLRTV